MGISKKRWLPVAMTVLISLVIITLLVITRPDRKPGEKQLAPARVELFLVQPRDFKPEERLVGRLQPLRRASLRFEVVGQVKKRFVEPGQHCKAGQTLLLLDASDYQLALSEAEAQYRLEQDSVSRDKRLLNLAEKNRDLQQKEVQRLEKLNHDSMVSRSLLDAARQKLAQLESEEARLQYTVATSAARIKLKHAALQRAKKNMERTRLTCPFDGIVNRVYVDTGDYVSPSHQAVDVIENTSLDLYVEVRGEVADALNLGQPVDLELEGKNVTGKIIALQADPDPTTFTHALRVRVPANVGYPGMMAHVSLRLPLLRGALAVPATAVIHEEGEQYVMLYQQGKLLHRKLKVGRRIHDWIVVLKGLQSGDRVVRRDVASLTNGQNVTVEKEYTYEALQ